MRTIVGLFFALLTGLAAACAPADFKGGLGTPAVLEFNLNGAASGHWCPGESTPRVYAVRWTKLIATPSIATAIGDMRFAGNPNNTITVLSRAYVDTPLADLTDVWGPMMARLEATRPLPELWAVASAAANANPPGTRPTYQFIAPATVRLDGQRISQGSPCDCVLARLVVGTSTYCSVQGLPAKVAVCVRTQ